MIEYEKSDIDELVRLLRKAHRGDLDAFRLAIIEAKDMHSPVQVYKAYDLIDFIYSQIKLARPTNSDIYESLKFVNARAIGSSKYEQGASSAKEVS